MSYLVNSWLFDAIAWVVIIGQYRTARSNGRTGKALVLTAKELQEQMDALIDFQLELDRREQRLDARGAGQ